MAHGQPGAPKNGVSVMSWLPCYTSYVFMITWYEKSDYHWAFLGPSCFTCGIQQNGLPGNPVCTLHVQDLHRPDTLRVHMSEFNS